VALARSRKHIYKDIPWFRSDPIPVSDIRDS
jgi:hypothetical protein